MILLIHSMMQLSILVRSKQKLEMNTMSFVTEPIRLESRSLFKDIVGRSFIENDPWKVIGDKSLLRETTSIRYINTF